MNVVIIKAGGLGTRAKQHIPKQFVEIKGKPLIVHTLECFQKSPMIDMIVVSTTEGYEQDILEFKEKYNLNKIEYVVTGGRSGLESILNASKVLEDLDDDCIVVIHEANRPIVTQAEIRKGIELTRETKKFGMSYRIISEHLVGFLDEKGRIDSSEYHNGFAIFVHPEYVTLKQLKETFENVDDYLLETKSSLDQLMNVNEINYRYMNFIQSSFNNLKVTFPEDFNVVAKYIDDVDVEENRSVQYRKLKENEQTNA